MTDPSRIDPDEAQALRARLYNCALSTIQGNPNDIDMGTIASVMAAFSADPHMAAAMVFMTVADMRKTAHALLQSFADTFLTDMSAFEKALFMKAGHELVSNHICTPTAARSALIASLAMASRMSATRNEIDVAKMTGGDDGAALRKALDIIPDVAQLLELMDATPEMQDLPPKFQDRLDEAKEAAAEIMARAEAGEFDRLLDDQP